MPLAPRSMGEETPAAEPPVRTPPGRLLFAQDGAYWGWRKVQGDLEPRRLSNFLLTVRERLVVPEVGTVLSVDVKVDGRPVHRRDVPQSAIMTKRELLKSLGSDKAAWFGTDGDIQHLRDYLGRHPAPQRQGTTVLGRHKVDGRDYIVFPDFTLSRQGIEDNARIRYVDLGNNETAKELQRPVPVTMTDELQHRKIAELVYSHAPRINAAEVVFPVLGWLFAAPWAVLIKRAAGWGGFPFLVLSGSQGSGKTSTAKLARALARAMRLS